MEKGKQSAILQLTDLQIVEPALTRRKPVGSIAGSGWRAERMEQNCAALSKQLRMVLLIARMEQKKPPQQRIGRHFGSAHQIAPAVGLGFGEAEQLARSPRRVEPDPPMDWPQHHPHHSHEKIGSIGIASSQPAPRTRGRPSCNRRLPSEYPEVGEKFTDHRYLGVGDADLRYHRTVVASSGPRKPAAKILER
jgi:hypothetical protein